jgi:hypothetical protein
MGFIIVVDVGDQGPVFDGRWEGIMSAYDRHVEDHIGDIAVHRIRTYLPTQYMYLGFNGGDPVHNPVPKDAGYLVAHVVSHRDTTDAVLVTDGGYPGMIYGPWIEGVGPGNLYFGMAGRAARGLSPRFPGYHAFQKISFELNMEAADLAQEELPPYLAALNE